MERREFLKWSLNFSALALFHMAGMGGCKGTKTKDSTIQLPILPYEKEALEPFISAKTINFHYGKHHQGYVNKTNKLIAGTEYKNLPLVDIIKKTQGRADKTAIFNNAAQVFNHTFYWNSMKPDGGGEPKGEIGGKIKKSFGSYDKFSEEFSNAAKSQFGSGWAWLVMDDNLLKIIKTSNADTPLAHGLAPLLTIDVWEHAYYLDYQNRRGDYIKAYLHHLVNWEFAENNMNQGD